MNPSAAALAVILLTADAGCATADPASLPDEAIKIRALRLAYSLNADRMVRAGSLGSIDVSGLLFVPETSLLEPPASVTPTPDTKSPSPQQPAPRPRK